MINFPAVNQCCATPEPHPHVFSVHSWDVCVLEREDEGWKARRWRPGATRHSRTRRRRSPIWWWPERCCLGCRARWPQAAARSSRRHIDPHPVFTDSHNGAWVTVSQKQDSDTRPVSCTVCRSPWCWFPWRRAEQISPPWPTRSPFCLLAWSS